METAFWRDGRAEPVLTRFLGRSGIEGACYCSVVPRANDPCEAYLRAAGYSFLQLTHATCRGVGIDYPRPESIGPDRLANAIAVKHFFGAPSVVVDFGTAVTFDVVNAAGNYTGGIIAPGISAMTDYLHEKTALLPKITIREPSGVIGRSTREAMLAGAVHGYRGLVRGLIAELKTELKARRLPVIATGGYAELIAKNLPEITAVEPRLTLEGLRLAWLSSNDAVPEREHTRPRVSRPAPPRAGSGHPKALGQAISRPAAGDGASHNTRGRAGSRNQAHEPRAKSRS
jgi:type III pantothenate kinase